MKARQFGKEKLCVKFVRSHLRLFFWHPLNCWLHWTILIVKAKVVCWALSSDTSSVQNVHNSSTEVQKLIAKIFSYLYFCSQTYPLILYNHPLGNLVQPRVTPRIWIGKDKLSASTFHSSAPFCPCSLKLPANFLSNHSGIKPSGNHWSMIVVSCRGLWRFLLMRTSSGLDR